MAEEYYIQRKKDDGAWQTVGYANDGDTTITFDNDLSILGDGSYTYRLFLISECDETSEASNIYTIQVEDEAIVILPKNDITDLRVETIKGGKFSVIFYYEPSATQVPTVFNIYSFLVENPSQEQSPSAYELILDGQLNYYPSYNFYTYTSTSFPHGDTISFSVFPAIEVGSISYEKENSLSAYAVSDNEGPIVTTDVIQTDLL